MLGVRNGGAAAWGAALLVMGGYMAYSGEYARWMHERDVDARMRRGEALMSSGETAERYKAALEEAERAKVKKVGGGWFGRG